MLPFLKRSQEASASGPVDTQTRTHDDGAEFDPMESAAQDLIDAVHSKDCKAVASALRAAIDIYDSGPSDAE